MVIVLMVALILVGLMVWGIMTSRRERARPSRPALNLAGGNYYTDLLTLKLFPVCLLHLPRCRAFTCQRNASYEDLFIWQE